MKRANRFFRYVWRINAVVILLAAAAITFGAGAIAVAEFGFQSAMSREAEEGIPVAGPDADARLVLGQAAIVPGTRAMSAQLNLYRAGGGLSSSGYSETRNVLFVEPEDTQGRWLVADDDHVVSDVTDLVADENDPKAKRVIASAALVKPAGDQLDTAKGRLLLFEPSGRRVVEVADNVRRIHLTSLANGEVSVLYERDRRLVLARFDGASFAKLAAEEIDVPQLK